MLHIPLTLYLLLIKILGIIALFWGTNSTFAAVTKTNYHYLTMVVFSRKHKITWYYFQKTTYKRHVEEEE